MKTILVSTVIAVLAFSASAAKAECTHNKHGQIACTTGAAKAKAKVSKKKEAESQSSGCMKINGKRVC